MTQEQKNQVARMREKNLGYAHIASELGISLNTIKAYCRRNNLSGDRSGSDTQPENLVLSSPETDLISVGSRGKTTTAKRPGALDKTGVPDDQPVCEVTVSYADEPDETAVADVLTMLKSACYGGENR